MNSYKLDLEKYAALARQAVAEGCVLLENEGQALPLRDGERVAVFGRMAFHYYKSGLGSGGLVNTRYVVGILDALKECEGVHLDEKLMGIYEDWIMENPYDEGQGWGRVPWCQKEMGVTEEMLDCARRDDVSLVVIGRTAGEDQDNNAKAGSYCLTETEEDMIRRVCEVSERTVVVLNVGNIIDMSWVEKYHPQAVLYVWQGGQEGGNGVADVLTGKACACGKLTDTIAADINDYPSTENFGDPFKNYYKEDIYVGYRYFDTFGIMPLYCFGYGKGYTDFSLVTKEVTADEKLVKVEVEVTNIGKVYPGREVVQVYYSAPDGVMEKPTQELAGFAKTKLLMPGEKEVVTVTFATEDMASYDSYDAAWVMEEGEYTIRVGNSSRTTEVAAIIDLDETVQTVLLKNVMKDKEFVKEIHHMVPIFDLEPDDTPFMRPILIYAENFKKKIMEYEVIRTTLEDKRPDEILTLEDVKKGAASLEELVAQLTVEEMADLCVGTERLEEGGNVIGSSSACVPGAAGDTTSALIEKRKIPNLILADGPAGLRLQTHFKTDKEGNKLPGGEQFGMEIAPFAKEQPEGAQDYYQYCTAIPIATTLAQSWDVDLIKRMGEIVGEEMEQFHIHLWLAPGMNIHRNPLCGRNFEYYSEDPLLTGLCAAADTKGVQSYKGHGTTIKHFAANNQEDNRMFTNAHISERALREIYLKGFEIAVKTAQPYAIMTSYNLINGTHAANHYDMLQNVARDEWGFEGFIMTDWYTSQDTTALGMVSESGKYSYSDGVQCIKAGNDLQMPGCRKNVEDIVDGVKNGRITKADLQRCAKHILGIALKTI